MKRVANLPWYDFEELGDATDALWSWTAGQLARAGVGCVPAELDRTTDHVVQWRQPEPLSSQACGYDVLYDAAADLLLAGVEILPDDACRPSSPSRRRSPLPTPAARVPAAARRGHGGRLDPPGPAVSPGPAADPRVVGWTVGGRARLTSSSSVTCRRELAVPSGVPALDIAKVLLCMFGTACSLQSEPAGTELLPVPTGVHPTGRMTFHWKDAVRPELETRAPDDLRELMVHVFYPADAAATGEGAVYVPDADAMSGVWNDAQVERITAMRAFSREGVALPVGTARFPVVVFAPGGGMKGLTYHTLCEDLASHGYVVAAIDPPYNARAVRLPDGRVLGNLPPEQRGWPAPRNRDDEQRFYVERVAHWARDVSFVIDQLAALDAGDGPLARRLDLARGVGVAGHSRGGQAAGAARLIDERVRGGINLDGTAGEHAILPIQGEGVVGAQPFLWIQKSLPTPPSNEQLQRAGRTRAEYDAEVERVIAAWHRALADVAGGAMRVCIDRPEVAHIDFSDEPFWDGLLTPATRPAKLRTIAETREWVRAFFDGTLRGDWAALKSRVREAGKSPQGVTVHVFGSMWE